MKLHNMQTNPIKALTTDDVFKLTSDYISSLKVEDIKPVDHFSEFNFSAMLRTNQFTAFEPLSADYNDIILKNMEKFKAEHLPKDIKYISTKVLELGSCAFRQWRAINSHCKFVHGYQLKAKFWFSTTTLDDRNWVVDFGSLKDFAQILRKQFDHTLCIAQDDPLLPSFLQLHSNGGCDLRIMDGVGIEKTAEWCLDAAKKYIKYKYKDRYIHVMRVEVWEHEENSAIAESLYPYNTY